MFNKISCFSSLPHLGISVRHQANTNAGGLGFQQMLSSI